MTFQKKNVFCLCTLNICLILFIVSEVVGSKTQSTNSLTKGVGETAEKDGVCASIDVRNKVKNLELLENCTVIEGQLHILLIDQATHLDYEKYSFPKLVEITDHLLLYRVYGLRTLRTLFPNLAVIRGQNLFNNYALIAYEMQDLETLGLIGLTTIMRGAVRLQKNTKLCYIDTIDWSRIATSVDVQYHYFEENKDEQECVNVCPEGCHENRCWTSEFCQKNLKCPCTSRYGAGFCNEVTGACCHEYCVGGCRGPAMNQCISCRNVTYNGHCQPACPAETYMFMNRRCLLDRECINISRKAVADHWKIIRHENTNTPSPGLCVEECPNGYSVDEKDATLCKKCEDYCPKECLGKTVDSIESAQKLKGCTKIKGPLEIQIMGGSNIGHELEASLGQIQEVTEYIKIVRSYALLSLGFFKNLRVIHGDKKQYTHYSLLIMDNANLQELFPKEVSSNISIKAGDVAFHFNRKLCYHKITDFLTKINVKYTDSDVSPLTNGDQIPCSVKKMDLEVRVGPNFAILSWQKFKLADSRQLLSYVINYREAKSKDVNIYQGRDACMDTTWKTYDANPDDYKDPDNIVELVFGLKPWTQYAAYIQTYSLATANEAANSELMFFTTHPYRPSTPTDLEVYSEEQGELRVRWNPPKHPNGNVTHYFVYWQLQELETEAFDKRDYCDNPILMPKKRKVKTHDEKTKYINQTLTKDGQCCQCPKSKRTLEEQQRQRQQQIEFENDLHDRIYTKRPELSNRKKRDNTQDDEPLEKDPITYNVSNNKEAKKVTMDKKKVARDNKNVTGTDSSLSPDERNATVDSNSDNSTRPVFNQIVVYGTEIAIPNLGHFQEYNIQVLACQESDPHTGMKYCSSRAIATARTLPSTTSDNVNASTVKIIKSTNKTQDILVTWKSPENPNGVIITFQIEYKKISTADVEPTRICFTHKEYRKLGGYKFQRLNPGNYSFRIKATSLAGNGSFTQPFFFVVPEIDVRTTNEAVIAAAVIGVLLVIIITIIIVWFVAKSKFAKDPDVTTISMNPGYVPSADVYIADDWEVSRDKIKLIRELGQGSFGMVYEGVAKDIGGCNAEVKVAVKTVNDSAGWHERMMFLKEASTMKSFSCHHVVKLLGVVSKGQPALVIMELMGQGDLKNFLRLHRPDDEENVGRLPPTLKQILQMAGEIADGMAYLADKKFVHRDLAARNCMVADDRTVKIGDFGMTRDIYETDYYRKGGKGLLPVRWMAPESLKDGIFTTMSDVWSYGVVLWEMATLAAQPYQGLSNEEVLKYVADGRFMEKPDGCPEKIYDLMCQCWRYRYKKRPTFKEIIEMLVPDLDPKFKDVSYFFSDENKVDSGTEYKNLQATEDQEDYGNVEFNEQSDDELDINDESRVPFMSAVEPSNLNSVEMQRSPSRHHHRDSSNTSPCECVVLEEMPNGHRNSTCSSPNSGVGYSDGSKGSSKSSNSSYTQLNGIANGHIHMRLPRTTPC